MPSYPAPDRKAHHDFCIAEGWTALRGVQHHVTFELALHDGRILRTRISRPPTSRATYGRSIWTHTLRDQLEVTESEFWECVQRGARPDRGQPTPPAAPLPADIVFLLVRRGVPEAEVLAMTRSEAIDRLNALLSQPE